MNKAQRISIIVCLVLSVLLISGAVLYSVQKKHTSSSGSRAQRTVSKAELKEADGKDGHICYVAVDGSVYEIEGFALWQNGQHTTSNGQAYCGADMSKVIDKAPHGRKILDVLTKVGPLAKA